jgi:hypothetical protein
MYYKESFYFTGIIIIIIINIIIIMDLQPFVWPWPFFFSFLILYTVDRTLGLVISLSQDHYLHTEQQHRINAHNTFMP